LKKSMYLLSSTGSNEFCNQLCVLMTANLAEGLHPNQERRHVDRHLGSSIPGDGSTFGFFKQLRIDFASESNTQHMPARQHQAIEPLDRPGMNNSLS